MLKKPKKILYVESGMFGGGSAESLYQLLTNLDRSKFSPIVLFMNRNRYFEKIASLNVPCFIYFNWLYHKEFNEAHPHLISGIWRVLGLVRRCFPFALVNMECWIQRKTIQMIVKLIQKENVALVHTNNQVHRDFYAIEAAKCANVPCIAHLRTHHTEGFNSYKAAYINKHTQKIIAYSQTVAEHWEKVGLEKEKISVIHNAISPFTSESADLQDSFGVPQNALTIGIIGIIQPEKGHSFIINAFRKVLEILPHAFLLVVGIGEEEHIVELKNLVTQNQLDERVIFTGYYANAVEVIAALDLITLPYAIEPFGRTLLEAWQLRTPAVISRVGHIEKIAQDRKHALLAGYGNQKELAGAIIEMLTDKSLREEIINNAFQHCNNNFLITTHTQKIEEIYKNILR